MVLDEALGLGPRGDLPVFFLLRKEAILAKPAERYSDRRWSHVAGFPRDHVAQYATSLCLVYF